MMVAVLNRRRRASKQCLEALFPLDKGRAGQVLSVEKQKIEDEVDKVHRTAAIRCCLKLGKRRGAIRSHRTELTIEVCKTRNDRRHCACRCFVSVRPIKTRARQQARFIACNPRMNAIAIIFEFVRPVWTRRRRFHQLGKLRRDERGWRLAAVWHTACEIYHSTTQPQHSRCKLPPSEWPGLGVGSNRRAPAFKNLAFKGPSHRAKACADSLPRFSYAFSQIRLAAP